METNLIQVKENETVTTSLLVAEKFNKRHDHMIRSIENLVAEIGLPNFGDTPLFEKSQYTNTQNGQVYPMYYMNRDGFTLLAMGFTGKEALQWKLKYIEAFNEMEKRIHSLNLVDNRLEIARLIIQAPDSRVNSIRELYPEYFRATTEIGSFEYMSDLNTSYMKWKEDYNISKEWLGDFPTIDIYNHYARYCIENRLDSMGKKTFYHTLEVDFNLTRRQKSNGYRYFLSS